MEFKCDCCDREFKNKKALSGHQGQLKSRETLKGKVKEYVQKYNDDPKLCLHCNQPIPYDKRQNNYCSQTCSAIVNNSKREYKAKEPFGFCRGCDSGLFKRWQTDFCSLMCQAKYRTANKIKDWLAGLIKTTKSIVHAYLITTFGYKCAVCECVDHCGKPLSLEIDHTDGNPSNNSPSNLRFICPNCHSQTAFYKGRNKGNGRKSRGLKLETFS